MKKLTKELLKISESIYENAMDYEEDDMMDWEMVELWGSTLQQLFFRFKHVTKEAPTMEEYERMLDESRDITNNMKHNEAKDETAEKLAYIIKALHGVLGE